MNWQKLSKLLSVAVAANAAMLCAVPPKVEYTSGDFRRISAVTAKILERNHYARTRIDRELSAKVFDRYFDVLDPMRMLFTAGDVERFSAYRDDLAIRLEQGEYEFAFQIYDLYRQRYREFREFTRKMLAGKVDFTVDEYLLLNPDKSPRPADEAAMRDLWRKRIKNDLLLFKLMEKNSSGSARKSAIKRTPAERILQRQRDIGNDIEKKDKIDILGILLDSLARSFGAHSDYQAPKLSEDFNINMSLSLSGIGATLTSEDGYIKIIELVPGGPAARSGKLKKDDRIVTVTQENGETTDLIDMPVSKAVQFIRGEKGTKVTLNILSGGSNVPREVVIVRDKVKLSEGAAKGTVRTIKHSGKNLKVGIIDLPGFYMDFNAVMRGDPNARKASSDVAKILQDFEKQQVDAVVMDLRKNGGGSLPDAIMLTGLFLSGQPLVQVRYQHKLEVEHDPDPRCVYAGPLVVLTSKFSASSAEIFTGALQDNQRAVIVGDSRTFGKGTVLHVESLDRYNRWFGKEQPAGSLTFEVAMFFRPSGGSVQQMGVVPDIRLPSFTEEMEIGEMFMDNHLPWDSIAPAKNITASSAAWLKTVAQLKKNSAVRVGKNNQFQAMLKRIGQFRSMRERKQMTLHGAKREAEYLKEKQVSEEVEALENESGSDSAEKNGSGDIVLGEAVNIAVDLAVMEKAANASPPNGRE